MVRAKDVIGQNIFKNETRRMVLQQLIGSANEPKYLYWDSIKHRPSADDLDPEEQWLLIKQYRSVAAVETPIMSVSGRNFTWVRLSQVEQQLHTIDMLAGGNVLSQSKITAENKEMYFSRGVIEEAIASSQLEGAHTTRAAAKAMLLAKRQPRNESEQMIVNNYRAMLALEEDFCKRELTIDLLFELHSVLTNGTVAFDEQKRLRRDSDEVVVQGDIGFQTYTTHVPPSETFLKQEIVRLIQYANDKLENQFVHPVVKAIFIHFWVGYLHPFTDGNGRLARALFYWYLLRNNYWAVAYLPISTVIRKAPIQYAMAYIYSEQDDYDLTYFFDYHMRKIQQAVSEFEVYVATQLQQKQLVEKVVTNSSTFSDRQKQLLHIFLTDEKAYATASTHAAVNNITRQTAAKELKQLEDQKLLVAKREGKYVRYYAGEKLLRNIKLVSF